MWKPVESPGEWLVFLQRKDIKDLPIMEAKKVYLQEQLLFEGYINNLNTVNTVNSTTSSPANAAAGGGGLRRYKRYFGTFTLSVLKGSDTPEYAGDYHRVEVNQLKRYWYNTFYIPPSKTSGYFSVPPPPSPDVNLGSDFVFVNPSNGNIIAWGRPKTRGRQKGQWVIWQFQADGVTLVGTTPPGKWVVKTEGPSDLKTPSGTYLYQDKDSKLGRIIIYYNLKEKEIEKPGPAGSLTVTGATSADINYVGNYIKDPSSGDGQDAVYIREDDAKRIYYSTTCAMWRIDNTGIIKLSCATWTGNPTGDSPLGTYQLSAARAPETGIYTVTQN